MVALCAINHIILKHGMICYFYLKVNIGNKYDYSVSNYVNLHTMIDVVCQQHGVFSIIPWSHLKNAQCKQCFVGATKKLTVDTFIEKARKVFGASYDYSLVVYKSSQCDIKIKCIKHNYVFTQTPGNHLAGKKSCVQCQIDAGDFSGVNITTEMFIERANIAHNNQYTYSDTVYTRMCDKLEITCKKHGNFFQLAKNHVKGVGCPKCYTSKYVTKVAELLEQLDISYVYNDRKSIAPKEIDFYLLDLNIGIEVNDTWTHNSETNPFGSPKECTYHQDKTKLAWSKNIKLIHLFENDIKCINSYKLKILLKQISKSTVSFEDPRLLLEYDKIIYDDGSIWSAIEYK